MKNSSLLGLAAFAAVAALAPRTFAQTPPPGWCIPGTTLCAGANGQGGAGAGGSASGRVNPQGAQGQANGQANGNGQGNGGAQVQPPPVPTPPQVQPPRVQPPPPPPKLPGVPPPPPAPRAYEPPSRHGSAGYACGAFRVGIWSGYKGGLCAGFSIRSVAFYLEVEAQVLAGGTMRTIDLTLPVSFVIPFDNERSLFEGPNLRFGFTPIGGSVGLESAAVNHLRFGIHAGVGYELDITPALAWKVFDARLYFDVGTKSTMDRLGHWFDLGAQVSTGLAF